MIFSSSYNGFSYKIDMLDNSFQILDKDENVVGASKRNCNIDDKPNMKEFYPLQKDALKMIDAIIKMKGD